MYNNPLLTDVFKFAEENPEKNSIIETSGKRITSGALVENITAIAANLKEQGFQKNDKVLILVRPGIDVVTFILAVLRLGGVVVVADPGMGKKVFQNRIKLARPRWVFIESVLFPIQGHPLLLYFLRKKGIEIPEFSNFGNAKIIRVGPPLPGCLRSQSYIKLLEKKSTSSILLKNLPANQEAMIVFTSGTMDMPKGVVHTISSLHSTLQKVTVISKLTLTDTFYTGLPHFLLMAVSLGITVVVPTHRFSPKQFLNDVTKYKPTVLFGPPAEFVSLVNYCKEQNEVFPTNVEKIFLGSAPVLSGFLKKLIGVISQKTQIICLYGMTEILPVAVADGRQKATWKGKGDLLGKIVGGVKSTIAPDGELILKGSNLFKQYLGFPAAKNACSGDLVKMQQGNLILLGRKKDMIIKGNHNIYPGLYEPVIQKIPSVLACAMVGVYDKNIEDEKIILAVEPENKQDKHFEKKIQTYLLTGEYSIDTQAMPDKIIVMKLPRSGRQSKINKTKLKEIIAEKYL